MIDIKIGDCRDLIYDMQDKIKVNIGLLLKTSR